MNAQTMNADSSTNGRPITARVPCIAPVTECPQQYGAPSWSSDLILFARRMSEFRVFFAFCSLMRSFHSERGMSFIPVGGSNMESGWTL
jgi:hypothetical protein